MAIKGDEFQNYVTELESRIKGKHISRPILVSHSTLFFHLSGSGDHRFVISMDSSNPRAYTAKEDKNLVSLDSPIYSTFRKELNNAYIEKVESENNDRILKFTLITINNVYKEENRYLIFEMFPSHPNLILLDSDNKIIAFTHGTSLESKRPIMKGLSYQTPAKDFNGSTNNLIFDYEDYQNDCLEKEQIIINSRKKERFSSLLKTLKGKLKKLKNKLIYIENDEKAAKTHLNDSTIGEYIYTNYSSLSSNSEFEIDGLNIKLDPSKSLSENANSFYKKSKKAKKTLEEISKQRQKTLEEIESLEDSILLLTESDEEGLESFAKEWGLFSKDINNKEIGSANIPYMVQKDGTTFLFGKTAKQNDTLTFLIDTKKNHYWFHIEKNHGAHVIIRKENPTQEEVRVACEITLLIAKQNDGDIMMTERKNVYKGSVAGQAIVRQYETIHLKNIREETRALFNSAKKMDLRLHK